MPATILCVEDEEDLREGIVEELHDAGYKTIEAENGKEALDAILAQKPDLVISNITMPVMDGHTLLAELRSNHPDKCDLPFVFLSALAEREHLVKGRKLGADDYLTKPVDYEPLIAAVEARLECAMQVTTRQEEQLVKVYKAALGKANRCRPAQPEAAPRPRQSVLAAPQPQAKAAAGAGPGPAGDVAAHLKSVVTATPTRVVAGRVQLLGLDDIKAALGERWERRSEILYAIAKRFISKRLDSKDVCQRNAAGDFTICFDRLDESAAAFKAREIADEIHAVILGKEFGQEDDEVSAEIKSLPEEIADDEVALSGIAVRGEAHEVEISVDEVENSSDLVALLTAPLEAAARESLRVERAALMEVANRSHLELRPVVDAKGEVTPFQFASFDHDAEKKVEALRSYRPASPDLNRDIDLLLLSKGAEEILRRPPGKNVVLIVNIHFSTINSKQRLEKFKKLCDALTDPARAALIFNVSDIPAALLPAKVAETFHSVRHFSRAMMAQCSLPALGNLDPKLLRTPILSYAASDLLKAAERNAESVAAFVKHLHFNKVRLLVYGIPDKRAAGQFIDLEIDFLSSR